MAKEVLFVVASLPTGSGHKRDIGESFRFFRDLVEFAAHRRTTALGEAARRDGTFDTVVVAPEYLFIYRKRNRRLPMTETEAIRLRAQLLGLSQHNPRVLLVPGTIFYQERTNEETVVKAKSNALAAEFAARRRAGPAPVGDSVKPSQLFGSRALQSRGTPVGHHVVDVRNIPDAKEREAELEDLELGDAKGDKFWGTKKGLINIVTGLKPGDVRARNRAYLMLAGKVLGMYDKHSDFFEVGKAPDKFFFIPGTREQCPEVDGLRIGLEICADHRLGVLARNTDAVDVQIVLSDCIDNTPANIVVPQGGVFIHASSNPSASCVRKRDAGGWRVTHPMVNYGHLAPVVTIDC